VEKVGKTTKRIKRTLVGMDDTCGSAVVRDIADVFFFETVSKILLVVDIGTCIAAFVVGYNDQVMIQLITPIS